MVLRNYCKLDEQQEYVKLYSLLSKRQQGEMRRMGAGTVPKYKELRESSEAVWSSFAVEVKSVSADGAVSFVWHATVEESGEAERVKFNARMVEENGKWKLDAWKY